MKKIIWKGLVLLAIIVIICYGLNGILTQKWSYSEDHGAKQIALGFYEEPEESLDVLYLGMSTVRNGISPLVIWNEYGYTGYSRASSIQPALVSYYLLLETLETQSPKVVFMETGGLIDSLGKSVNDYDSNEEKLHEMIDHMEWSFIKYQMAKEIVENSQLSMADLLIPVYRYHDRWQSLTKADFEEDVEGESYAYKGHFPALKQNRNKLVKKYMEINTAPEELNATTAFYVEKMAQVCQENGITLVLLSMPTTTTGYPKHDVIQEFADAQGLDFIDFNLPEVQEEFGFKISEDYRDSGGHLNASGATKVSSYIGKYLSENFDLTDKRSDSAYSQWHEAYQLYACELEDYELATETNLFEYIKYLNNPRYLIAIAGKSDLSMYYANNIVAAMETLGIQTDLAEYPFQSYGAIIDNQTVIWEQVAEEPVGYTYETSDYKVEVSSDTSKVNTGPSSILIDGVEYSRNENGLNFVVYDKVLKRVVAMDCYDTGRTGQKFTKKED